MPSARERASGGTRRRTGPGVRASRIDAVQIAESYYALTGYPRPGPPESAAPFSLMALELQPTDAAALLRRLEAANRPGGLATLAQASVLLHACEAALKAALAASAQHAYDMRERCAQIAEPQTWALSGKVGRARQVRMDIAAAMRALTVDEGA